MPSRSWSLNQHGNSLMSIVIGPRNDGAYPISKTAPKSKRRRASCCSLHCGHVAGAARFKGERVSGAAGIEAVSPTFTQCLSRGIKCLIIGLYVQYEGGTK